MTFPVREVGDNDDGSNFRPDPQSLPRDHLPNVMSSSQLQVLFPLLKATELINVSVRNEFEHGAEFSELSEERFGVMPGSFWVTDCNAPTQIQANPDPILRSLP